ncbi:hypothetical protein ABTY98_37385 [Streptomyces sp. NPDC096040]|uniref:hypothetical protein n=1 Tax=Streptomyces sp. NPDC096040 TaxID=3155541 RepID=UPI00331A0FCA
MDAGRRRFGAPLQPTAESVHHQLDAVADVLGQQFPKVRQMLLDAKEDLTALALIHRRGLKVIF